MSLYNCKNVFHVFVGYGTTVTVDAVQVNSYANLYEGEVVLLDANNKVVNTAAGAWAAADNPVRFAQRTGTSLYYGPYFTHSQIVSANASTYTAPVMQVSTIGYGASSLLETIPIVNNNEYIVRIEVQGLDSNFGNKKMYKFGAYKSSAAATGAEIATGLVDNLNANFKREPTPLIQFNLLSSVAVTDADVFDHATTVVNGSDRITVATDLVYTGSTAAVVGDYVRLGSVAGGTALTSSVYKIIAIDSLTLTLDRAVTEASGTYATATYDAVVIPAATAIGATVLWGIKATGIAQSNFEVSTINYYVPMFKIGLTGFGAGKVTEVTAPVWGVGSENQVREVEWFGRGNRTFGLRRGIPYPTFTSNVVAGSTYESIDLKFRLANGEGIIGDVSSSFGEMVLFFHKDSNVGNGMIATLADLLTITNAWS